MPDKERFQKVNKIYLEALKTYQSKRTTDLHDKLPTKQ